MFNYQRTQTTREPGTLAAPMRDLMFGDFDLEHLVKGLDVLHFGEGKDWWTTYALKDAGARVSAYDPYSPYTTVRDSWTLNTTWDIIVSSYVYNVIPPRARQMMWEDNQRICAVQIWSVRADKVKGTEFMDGVHTKANTFQKSYDPYEAQREWPNATIISYNPGRWITMFQRGLLYPRNLSVPMESRSVAQGAVKCS